MRIPLPPREIPDTGITDAEVDEITWGKIVDKLHASAHAAGQPDAITPGSIGAEVGGLMTAHLASAAAHSMMSITERDRLFNNDGKTHAQSAADFNAMLTCGFHNFIGTLNSPSTTWSQYYVLNLGLGNDYAFSAFGVQIAIPRNANPAVAFFRNREASTWTPWRELTIPWANVAGYDSGFQVPVLASGWAQYGGNWLARYRKLGNTVTLSGLVARTTTASSTIFVLPAGYRPPSGSYFKAIGHAGGVFVEAVLYVDPSGVVACGHPATTFTWLSISMTFTV